MKRVRAKTKAYTGKTVLGWKGQADGHHSFGYIFFGSL